MDKRLLGVAAASIGAVAMAAVAAFVAVSATGDANATQNAPADLPLNDPSLYAGLELPDFELVDQHGKLVTRDDVVGGGRWTVLDFMFTNCTLVCPIMSGNMLRVNEAIEDDRVRFVSISVDPEHDTVRSLRAFGERLGADDRWRFLATEPGEPDEILAGLGLALGIDSGPGSEITLKDGSTMQNIVHPVRFLVFNPRGEIVGSYRGTDAADVDRLIRDLRRVLDARTG
jgi:protein SCO1/2